MQGGTRGEYGRAGRTTCIGTRFCTLCYARSPCPPPAALPPALSSSSLPLPLALSPVSPYMLVPSAMLAVLVPVLLLALSVAAFRTIMSAACPHVYTCACSPAVAWTGLCRARFVHRHIAATRTSSPLRAHHGYRSPVSTSACKAAHTRMVPLPTLLPYAVHTVPYPTLLVLTIARRVWRDEETTATLVVNPTTTTTTDAASLDGDVDAPRCMDSWTRTAEMASTAPAIRGAAVRGRGLRRGLPTTSSEGRRAGVVQS